MHQPPRFAKYHGGVAGCWVLVNQAPCGLDQPRGHRYLETRTMFQEPFEGADAANFRREPEFLPEHAYEPVRHTVLGSLTAVGNTIKLLHKLNYAEPNDWSKPLPTGRPNEVMAILTKKIRVD